MEIALIVLVNLLLYCKTLRYKFVSDDFSTWKNPPVFKNPFHKLFMQLTGQAKIYSKAVHFVHTNKRWFIAVARTEEMEHLLTLLIHILICISIYFAFGADQISFITALLFAVNPVNNQATMWPGGRGYALPILFLTLAMSLPYLSPVLLYACSWYTIGFLAPLALIGSKYWMVLASLPFVWLLHRKKFKTAVIKKRSTETFAEDRLIHPKKLILGIKTYGFYLTLCLIPFRITFYHNFLQSAAGSLKHKCYTLCRYFWAGIAWMAFLIGYVWFIGWDSFAWALLAFSISILPFCNIVRANQEIAERFTALPNVFLMFALAQVIYAYPVVISGFLAFYATRTYYTLDQYKDEYWITERAVCEDPHAWWAWHCRAMKRWDTQSYREALILWVMAKIISPKEFKILINIATCLRLLKNDKEADEYLKAAEENIVPGQEETARQYILEHKKGKLPILL